MRLVRLRAIVGGCVLAASLTVTGGASAGPSARAPVQLGAAVHAWMTGAATVTSPIGLSNEQVNIDSNPPEVQNDPTVAVSLRDPDVAVAAYYDRSSVVTQVARTSDGGRHWSAQRITLRDHADTSACFAFAAVVAYSLRDDAFYLFVACGQLAGLEETQLLESVDGGLTWTSPLAGSVVDANHAPGSTTVTDPSSFDHEALAIDNNPSSSHYGRIYAGDAHFENDASGVPVSCAPQVAYTDRVPASDPTAAVWTHTPVAVPGADAQTDASATAYLRLVVDDQGGVDVLYANESCLTAEDFGVRFTRSTDGGASYPAPAVITRRSFWRDNRNVNDILPHKGSVRISAVLAFNPVTHTLAASYQNFRSRRTSQGDVSFQRSTDYGATWQPATPLAVQADGSPAPQDQMLSWIAADPATGDWHAIWLDQRNDPGDRLIETFQGFSADDGVTWTNVDISTAPWDSANSDPRGTNLGNYTALAVLRQRLYPLWPDARNPGPIAAGHGGFDIYTNVEPHGSPAQP